MTLTAAFLGIRLLGASAAMADPGAMTPDDYKLYREYVNALEDPRVQRMKPRVRDKKIARNFRVSLKKLKQVARKGAQVGAGLVKENEEAAKAAIEKSKVAKQVDHLELVDHSGVVIAYVSWKGTRRENLAKEAAYVAKAISEASPLTNTLAMWSCMGRKKVFTAKIRASSGRNIKEDRIEDFAETRYLRYFEDVHNVFEGKPPEKPVIDPETGKAKIDPKTGKKLMEPDLLCE